MTEQRVETWNCGKCHYKVIIPWQELSPRDYANVLMGIREHRFAHLVSALETATDEELMRMSGDGDVDEEAPEFPNGVDTGPVRVDDAAPIIKGIERMLRSSKR